MKLIPMLAVASLLSSAAAFAQTPPAAPAASPPAATTPAPKHHSRKYCHKHANAQNLTGADRAAFIKSCRAGTAS
jgi:hypothetical protein